MATATRLECADGIRDPYSGLIVGPCTREEVDREVKDGLFYEASAIPDEFDCTYAEWDKLFAAKARAALRGGWPNFNSALSGSDGDGSDKLLAKSLAEIIELADGSVRPHNGHWIACDSDRRVLTNARDPSWEELGPRVNPVLFDSAGQALAGLLLARAAEVASAYRHEWAVGVIKRKRATAAKVAANRALAQRNGMPAKRAGRSERQDGGSDERY